MTNIISNRKLFKLIMLSTLFNFFFLPDIQLQPNLFFYINNIISHILNSHLIVGFMGKVMGVIISLKSLKFKIKFIIFYRKLCKHYKMIHTMRISK